MPEELCAGLWERSHAATEPLAQPATSSELDIHATAVQISPGSPHSKAGSVYFTIFGYPA
jgi:hypothetical protein